MNIAQGRLDYGPPVAVISDAVDWLKSLFSFRDILHTAQALEDGITKMMDFTVLALDPYGTEVHGWFTDDTPKRFEAYGWHVVPNVDGHDPAALERAIQAAQAAGDRPSLICCKTIIGFGAPNKQGTEATHGAALGAEEVAAARKQLNWPYPPFEIPDAIRKGWDAHARGAAAEKSWQDLFSA